MRKAESVSSENICDCPNPPGGRAVCPSGHLAICRVRNGQPFTYCKELPQKLTRQGASKVSVELALQNWVLQQVSGFQRAPQQKLKKSAVRALTEGVYESPTGEEIVRFQLPQGKP
jgi:hypothetical protein